MPKQWTARAPFLLTVFLVGCEASLVDQMDAGPDASSGADAQVGASDGGSLDAAQPDGSTPTACTTDPECDDGQFCNGSETCGPGGTCLPGRDVDCSPWADDCNLGECNELTDMCEPIPGREGQGCEDGVFCTVGETCSAGVCGGGEARTCKDVDACTDDSCDEANRTCLNIFDAACTVCSTDIFEPNDTRMTAVSTSTGTHEKLYACLGDEDWHAFDVGNNQLIEVLVSFQDAIGDINLRLYDDNGMQVASSISATDDEQIAYTAAAAGTYFLLVDFNELSGDDDDIPGNRYSMTVGLGRPCTDRFEDNEDLLFATPLGTGEETLLEACPYDDDWYSVSVPDNGLVIANALFEDAQGDLDLRLYNDAQQQVAASLSNDDNEQIMYTAATAGTYYLRVILNRTRDDVVPGARYDLLLDLDDSCTDAFENNDTRQTSVAITDGSRMARACPSDEDWYSFVASANHVIRVETLFEASMGDINLRLYDAGGAQLAASLSATNDESIVLTAPNDGVYSARVIFPGTDDMVPGNDYELVVGTSTACTDLFEENDSMSSAPRIGSGSFPGLVACPGDDDWYQIPVSQVGRLTVDLTFTHSSGNVDARLFDAGGSQVAAALSGGDNEKIEFDVSVAADHFLRVFLTNDDQTPGNSYQLSVAGADPCVVTSCMAAGAECGPLHDGCGGSLDCGGCSVGSCSANNRCGCMPETCESLGLNCGSATDGCGTPLLCGQCTDPQLCGGAHTANVCAEPDCPPDALEANDSRATASPVSVGDVSGLLACPGDDDYYAIALASNDLLIADASFIDAEGNLDLRLYNEAGSQVDTSLSQTDNERLVYTAPAAGTYTLRAFLAGADDTIPGVAYGLSIITAPCTDAFEDADDQGSAATVAAGTFSNLFGCPHDDDWFHVVAGNNELIDVTLRFVDALGNIDLRLYNAGGQQLATSLSSTDDERIVYVTPEAGDYYLRVIAHEAGDDAEPGNKYTMELNLGSLCTDRFEDNDSRLLGTLLGAGTEASLTLCPFDEDWYTLTAADNTLIEAEATFTHADGNIDFRLYDARGNQVATSLTGTDNERIAYTTPSAGTFHLRGLLSTDADPPGNTYALTLSNTNECNDVFENNDSRGGAYQLGAGSFANLTACPSDDDWYALELDTENELNLALTFSDASGNIDVRLYDPSGSQVATSLSGTDDELLVYSPPVAGTYFARVLLASDDGTPGNGYSMVIAGANPCQPTVSCASAGAACGPLHDGCETTLDCGPCPGTETCSPNNICNCQPATCATLGAECGAPTDGCGLTLFCGDCMSPELCGGAYVDFVCASPSCPEDSLEDNDTRQDAPELMSGTHADLTLCPGDEDWYELDLANNVVILADFEFDNTKGDVNVRLYNASGTQLDASLSGTSNERLVYTTPALGTYFVRAQLVGVDDAIPGNQYQFVLDTSQVCTDGFEDNDREQEAQLLGSGMQSSLTACPNDEDWFEFVVGNNELIEVDLRFSDLLGNIDIRLYDAAGQQVATSLSGTDDERIAYTSPQAGTYRLRVLFNESSGDDAQAGNNYDLSLALGAGCTDAFEDNDALDNAVVLNTGTHTALRSCPFDEDWYRLDVGSGRKIDLAATFTHSDGNIDIRLYNATGQQLATSLSGTDDERIEYTTPNAGPFYARVVLVSDDGVPGNDYTITFSDLAP